MQLDKTYIAIRERDFLEILDLALHVILRFLAPLAWALAAGIVPLAIASHYWIGDVGALDEDASWRFAYTFNLIVFAVLTSPLATAPATLLLGQVLFMERTNARRIARDFATSLPQLILFQVIARGILICLVFTAFVPLAFWAYLGEIVLLERNPLWQGKSRRITTMKRNSALHGGSGGELFSRWLCSVVVAALLGAMIVLALWGVTQWISGKAAIDRTLYAIYLQIAVWMVVGYFSVVRFLSYLDLRIRREGWEVELKMRAEAARLESELI